MLDRWWTWRGREAAVAVVALAAIVAGCSAAGRSSPGSVTASRGGLTISVAGSGLTVSAAAGTFPAGTSISVHADPGGVTDTGGARVLGTPITLTATAEPSRPVAVTVALPAGIDAANVLGVISDDGAVTFETLPVLVGASGSVTAEVPHFSLFAFLAFGDPAALDAWVSAHVVDGVVSYLKDFFDAPYDCPTPKFQSALLQGGAYPANVRVQLDASDAPGVTKTARLEVCNELSLVMTFTAAGAVKQPVSELSLPRSAVPTDVALAGMRGDPFTVTVSFTPAAFVATAELLALGALPGGESLESDVIKEGVFSPDNAALISQAAASCQSAIAAASAAATAVQGALGCLQNLSTFGQAVSDLWSDTAISVGLDEAGKSVPYLNIAIAGEPFLRIIDETFLFGFPSPVTFEYTLACTTGQTCPGDTPPPVATTTSTTAPPVTPGGMGAITETGAVGSLQIGRSTQSEIEAAAGPPDDTTSGSFEAPGDPNYVALAYGCSQTQVGTALPFGANGGAPYCLTVYFLDSTNGVLEAFSTASAHFHTANGTTIGTPSATAQHNENGQFVGDGCGTPGITEYGQGPVTIKIDIPIGSSGSAGPSDPVTDINVESTKNPVGLLFC